MSHVDKNGIAFPTVDAICEALDLKSVTMVKRSLKNLEDTGFLLRNDVQKKSLRRQNVKIVYQRPRAHFTLICLLNQGLLDEQLRPVKSSHYDEDGRSDPLVRAALASLLTLPYYRSLYYIYERFKNESSQLWPNAKGLKAKILCAFLSGVHEYPELEPISDLTQIDAQARIQKNIEDSLQKFVRVPASLWTPTAKRPKKRRVIKPASS